MTACSLVDAYKRSGVICYLNLQIRSDFGPKKETRVGRSTRMETEDSSETLISHTKLQGFITQNVAVYVAT
jgi:hypothetical protein